MFGCVLSNTSFLNLTLIIRIILFSVLVEVAAEAAKQDSIKEKMRKPEEGTASFWLFFLCFFVVFCHITISTKTLELPVICSYAGDSVRDKGIWRNYSAWCVSTCWFATCWLTDLRPVCQKLLCKRHDYVLLDFEASQSLWCIAFGLCRPRSCLPMMISSVWISN